MTKSKGRGVSDFGTGGLTVTLIMSAPYGNARLGIVGRSGAGGEFFNYFPAASILL